MRSAWLSAAFGGVLIVFAQQCYNPDGTRITSPAYQPCNQVDGTISQCCGTNHTGGKIAPDKCLPNGLCQNTGDLNFWRNGCTDPTFKSPNCLRICLDDDVGGDSADNAPMRSCGGNKWCCAKNFGSRSCCDNTTLVFSIPDFIGQPLTTSSSTKSLSTSTSVPALSSSKTSTGDTISTSSTSSSTPSSSETPVDTDKWLSLGAKIGLGVGIPVAVLVIGALIGGFFFLRKRDRKRFEALLQQRDGEVNNDVGGVAAGEVRRQTMRYEMDGTQQPVEMDGDVRRDGKSKHEMYR